MLIRSEIDTAATTWFDWRADCPVWDHVVQLFACCRPPGAVAPPPCKPCQTTPWLAGAHDGGPPADALGRTRGGQHESRRFRRAVWTGARPLDHALQVSLTLLERRCLLDKNKPWPNHPNAEPHHKPISNPSPMPNPNHNPNPILKPPDPGLLSPEKRDMVKT